MCGIVFYFFKQKTAYEMRISDWSSDVCSSDLVLAHAACCGPVVGVGEVDGRGRGAGIGGAEFGEACLDRGEVCRGERVGGEELLAEVPRPDPDEPVSEEGLRGGLDRALEDEASGGRWEGRRVGKGGGGRGRLRWSP